MTQYPEFHYDKKMFSKEKRKGVIYETKNDNEDI